MDYYGYIYITTNLVNGKKYIGQHKSSSFDTKYYGSGINLNRAMKKYGKENFRVYILQWCKTKWDANVRERAWILMYDAVHSPDFYNIARGGDGGSLPGKDSPRYGKTFSKESREKMSKSHIGLQRGENNGMYGKQQTEETRRKISKTRIDNGIGSGENNPSAKLTEKDVLEIVTLRKQGFLQKEIAQKFGVSRQTISRICNGNKWSRITGIIPIGSRNWKGEL